LLPLRIRDFRLLWSGMTVSMLGDGVYMVALAWEVYRLSNVPTALAYVGVASTAPQVVLLVLGGLLTDRVERRRLMIAADLLRMAAIGAAAILLFAGELRMWHLIVVAALASVGSALFMPAFSAIVPEIVPAELLAEANALDHFVRPASRLLGPALGGLLVAYVGMGSAFAFNSLSFGCSALALSLLTARPLASNARSLIDDLKGGIAAVRAQTWLWAGLLAGVPMNLASGAGFVLLPLVVKNHVHGSAGTLGLVYSLGAVGSITAAYTIGQRGLPRRHITIAYWGWAIGLFLTAGYAAATAAWQLFLISFAGAAAITLGQIIWATLVHRLVPGDVLGRVSSLDYFTSFSLIPLSYLLVGYLAKATSVSTALYTTAAWGGISTLVCLYLIPNNRASEHDGTVHPLKALKRATPDDDVV
jgi:DHA3 family tetracycline resistance protein-like MFS transporter